MKEKAIITDWFNMVLDHTPEPIMAFKALRDKNGTVADFEFLFANKMALQFTSRYSLAGKSLSEEFSGTTIKGGLFEIYAEVLESGQPWSGEVQYNSDGFDIWAYVSVSKMDDGCIVSFTDVSARKMAEEKVRQQAHFIAQVMAMAPDIITVLELPSYKMIYSNERNLAYHGFDLDEMERMTREERRALIHPDDRARLDEFLASFKGSINDDDIVSCEYRAINKPGEWLWFLVRSKVFERNADGTVRSIVNLIQNITDRKLKELRALASKGLLEGITGVVPDMISVQDYPSRDMIFYHPYSFSMLGYDLQEVEQMTPEERNKLVHPDDMRGLVDYWESFKTLPGKDIISFEYRANVKSRGWIWLRVRGKVFERDGNGQVKTILIVIQDITDRKYAELKVQQLNKALILNNKALEAANSEIKMFSNIAANDYSETLRHLYTNLELIVSQDARRLSDSGRANVRRAQSAIQKMRLLTDDLMAYTKLQESGEKRQEVDVPSLVRRGLMDFSNHSNLFHSELHCDEVFVFGYPFLLSLLFHHLIDNAIKFRKSDNGHQLVIICRKEVNGATIKHKGALDTLQYHLVTFSDNGIGFTQEESEKIFDIFTRLHEKNKYRGSGVGLAVCKKVMDLHGGFIVAESQPGNGASFHCYFPV